MVLRQLMLSKKIETLRSQLEEFNKTGILLSTRESELTLAIEEAKTEEECKTVEGEVDKLTGEISENKANIKTLSKNIEDLERELAEVESKKPDNDTENTRSDKGMPIRNFTGLTRTETNYMATRHDIRMQVRESLKNDVVKDFYSEVRSAVLEKRAISEGKLIIPHEVIDRIQVLAGDYGNLYKEVDVIQLSGTARIVIDGANPEAIWVEMCDPIVELATSFKAVELDGFKLGGFIPVCNAILEDSMINLAMYIERKLAIAIAKALDKAIPNGLGAAQKQLDGIIPNLHIDNIVTLSHIGVGGLFGSFFASLALIDTGEGDSGGELIVAMKRSTYYAKVAPLQIIANANGTFTTPNVNNPNIAGLRVVFSQNIPTGKLLVGDYKKYVIGERSGITLSTSKDVRFIEDQTVFKGLGRYDGRPVDVDVTGKTKDWVLCTIPDDTTTFALPTSAPMNIETLEVDKDTNLVKLSKEELVQAAESLEIDGIDESMTKTQLITTIKEAMEWN